MGKNKDSYAKDSSTTWHNLIGWNLATWRVAESTSVIGPIYMIPCGCILS